MSDSRANAIHMPMMSEKGLFFSGGGEDVHHGGRTVLPAPIVSRPHSWTRPKPCWFRDSNETRGAGIDWKAAYDPVWLTDNQAGRCDYMAGRCDYMAGRAAIKHRAAEYKLRGESADSVPAGPMCAEGDMPGFVWDNE